MLHISKCFNQNMINIQSQVEKIRELQKLIVDYIPAEMQNICKIASFNNGCLILQVDDSIWASQLRFLIPEIRDNLRKNHNLYQLSNIKITVNRDLLVTNSKKATESTSKSSHWKKILDSLR